MASRSHRKGLSKRLEWDAFKMVGLGTRPVTQAEIDRALTTISKVRLVKKGKH